MGKDPYKPIFRITKILRDVIAFKDPIILLSNSLLLMFKTSNVLKLDNFSKPIKRRN